MTNRNAQLTASASVSMSPHFDKVSATFTHSYLYDQVERPPRVYTNAFQRLSSTLQVDTPFKELPYLKVNLDSTQRRRSELRHSVASVEMGPGQTYTVDTLYSFDLPRAVDLTFNLTTPRPELPLLHTVVAFNYGDDEVKGKFKLVGPVTDFEEFSTDFGHQRGHKQVSLCLLLCKRII
jgi:hypothetical protein